TPRPTPPPTRTAIPSMTVAPTPRGAPTASPSPSPTASASATDQPAPSPSPSADPELARAKDAARLLTARSLAEVIAAQARVAQDELAALDDQVAQLAADENDIVERLAALQKAIDERRANPDRIARDALRLAAPDPATAPPNLNAF